MTKEEHIEIQIYKPIPDHPHGTLRYSHSKELGVIRKEIECRLRKQKLWDTLDYFREYPPTLRGTPPSTWPYPYNHIACFAVTGGNEGHYIYVHAFCQEQKGYAPKLVFCGKTFSGMEAALKISNALTIMLGA